MDEAPGLGHPIADLGGWPVAEQVNGGREGGVDGSAVWLRPQRMGCEWVRPREAWKSFLGLFIRLAFACGFSEAALPAVLSKPRYRVWDENEMRIVMPPYGLLTRMSAVTARPPNPPHGLRIRIRSGSAVMIAPFVSSC